MIKSAITYLTYHVRKHRAECPSFGPVWVRKMGHWWVYSF